MRCWRVWYVGACYLCWKRRREVFVSSSGDAAGRKQGVALAIHELHDDVARLSRGLLHGRRFPATKLDRTFRPGFCSSVTLNIEIAFHSVILVFAPDLQM